MSDKVNEKEELMWNLRIPKVELHCHLDGSLPAETIRKLAFEAGIVLPQTEEMFRKKIQVAATCENLTEYLKTFELPLQCLISSEAFYQAAYDFVKAAAKENVRYVEVRFAPLLSVTKTLTCDMIIESVLEGFKAAQDEYGVYAAVILCGMRHQPVKENISVAVSARKYLRQGVCGLDLAGDESKFPLKFHKEFFAYAKKENIPFTIHAGECGNSQNITEAVEAGAKRIGHGIAMRHRDDIMKECLKRE